MRPEALPSIDEKRHSERLHAVISDEIATSGGFMGFDRFMQLALYEPGLGYYSAGARKFGRDGDFVTAPEISPLFGSCVARQCGEILADVEGGSILEVGAGTGRLAVDVLMRLEFQGRLPSRYYILDVSADLRERQLAWVRNCIPHLSPLMEWLDAPPPFPFDGVILANEVLDALPVARFRWDGRSCEELGVALDCDDFTWSSRPAGSAMREACASLAASAGGWEAGYTSEYCPSVAAWSRNVAGGLQRGAVLWFDYGLPRPQYYLPERHDGTLICHFRQRANDNPFARVGLQDISAWVDFTAVAEAAAGVGCEVAGFTTQAFFLAGLGIDQEMLRIAGADESQYLRLASQAKQLMLPGEMGERFKAMAWTRSLTRELSGFALQDLRHTL